MELKLYSYFKDRFNLKKSTNSWHLTDCPECKTIGKKRLMRISFSLNHVSCFSASCSLNSGTRLMTFVMNVEDKSYKEAKDFINTYSEGDLATTDFEDIVGVFKETKKLNMPFGYKTIMEGDGLLAKRARTYLANRGFDLDVLDMDGIGYCDEPAESMGDDYFGYIIIPYKSKGLTYYYNARDYLNRDKKYKYKNPRLLEIGIGKSEILYNEDVLNKSRLVYITEGAFDSMTLGNSVALGGKILSIVQRSKILKSKCDIIVLALDGDFPAEALRVAFQLINHKIVYYLDLGGKDPNELGKDKVEDILKESLPLTYKDILLALHKL